ncbi:unnamed protein product, partial [Amoebophrya sp. A25]
QDCGLSSGSRAELPLREDNHGGLDDSSLDNSAEVRVIKFDCTINTTANNTSTSQDDTKNRLSPARAPSRSGQTRVLDQKQRRSSIEEPHSSDAATETANAESHQFRKRSA